MPIQKSTRISLAIIYLLIISTLFFLPGSAFPKDSWLKAIYFDKWVHIGLFATCFVAWAWAFRMTALAPLIILFILLCLYGYAVEIIQQAWISNRSFDATDIMADVAGNLIGIVFWKWRGYAKK